MSRKAETLKAAAKTISETAARLKEVGLDELAAELRASASKVRRELNHIDAVKDHPDLFA